MKIPPPPPSYDKDKTLTRRSVKGAAGGMKGVDYEDDGHGDPAAQRSARAGTSNRGAADAEARVSAAGARAGTSEPPKDRPFAKDEGEMILQDEDAASRDEKTKQGRRPRVTRDRMTVDKDAPEHMRQRRWDDPEEDEPHESSEDAFEEIDLESVASAILSTAQTSRAHLFERREDPAPGDPALTDPDAAQKALGAPIAYAKHVMILAEAFRRSTGATREEGIAYLARMFVGLEDRGFGRAALKEFGLSTGIVDIYPLEIAEHILERYPFFLPKAGFGRVFSCGTAAADSIVMYPKVPATLRYPPEVKVRGFALKGGQRPGYRFEPASEAGAYRLTIESSGIFVLLISALARSGHTIIDRLRVEVRGKISAEEAEELRPPRDEAKVRAWPMPNPPAPDYAELLADPAGERRSDFLSSGEIVRMQQLDALRGPKGADTDLPSIEIDLPRSEDPPEE